MSTQFNKYYNDFLVKKNATMHLNHKPGEIMQVDWRYGNRNRYGYRRSDSSIRFCSHTAFQRLQLCGSVLSMNQECWTSAHVNAYRYFGGVARIIQCDNLKNRSGRCTRNEVL